MRWYTGASRGRAHGSRCASSEWLHLLVRHGNYGRGAQPAHVQDNLGRVGSRGAVGPTTHECVAQACSRYFGTN